MKTEFAPSQLSSGGVQWWSQNPLLADPFGFKKELTFTQAQIDENKRRWSRKTGDTYSKGGRLGKIVAVAIYAFAVQWPNGSVETIHYN